MKRKQLLMMLLALMVPLATMAQAPDPVVPYLETFESYNLNGRPANWSFSTNGIVNGNVAYGVNTTNGLNGTKSLRMLTPSRTTSDDPIYIIAKLPVFDYQANFLHLYFNSQFTSTGTNSNVKLQVGYVQGDTFHQVGSNVSTSTSYGTEHHFSFNDTSIPADARIAIRQISLSGARYEGIWDIDNVNVYLDYKTPSSFAVSDITNTSAYLSWDIAGNYSTFEVEYATNSNFAGAINEPTNNKYFSLTNLSPNTTYYTRVRAKYIDSNHSYYTYGNWTTKSFTTTCDPVTGLEVSPENITETNIRVTWDDNLVKDVDLEYKQSSETTWMTLGNAQNYNYYNMSVSGLNLQAGTLYQVRAKFPCSDWCEPVEFRTAFGGADQLMYTFVDGMPADFTVTGAGADNVSVSTEQSFGADEHSLKYSFVSGNPVPSPGTTTIVEIGTYLRTYSFDAFMVYFDMYCHEAHSYENVALQYDAWVTSGAGAWQDNWRTAVTWSAFYDNLGWVEKTGILSLPSELQGGVSKLRFRLVFTDHGSGENTYIDNFHIFPKGGCQNVYTSSQFYYDATTSTTATFHWTDPNYDATVTPVAHSLGFTVRYRNLTIPTNTITGWIEEYVWVDDSNPTEQYSITLNDLDPSSYHVLDIRTLCPDGGYTAWSAPHQHFATDCQPYELKDMEPFVEDFNDMGLACWTYNSRWERVYEGHGGSNWCLRSNVLNVPEWNDYIDTPEIELNSNYITNTNTYLVLRFWTKCSSEDGTGNKVKVVVGDQVTEIYELPEMGCDQWQQVHLSLSRWLPDNDGSANTIKVRFDHQSSATAEWFIDDVMITSWDVANYGTRIFDDAVSNDKDWTNDNNWYPNGAPTNSPSMDVTLMGTAWVPNNCNSTVGTLRFGTQGYLDVQPGGNLTVAEVDIPDNKVYVEADGTLNIGTAHFDFDKIFTDAEGTYNITNLNVYDHWLNFNNGNAPIGTATVTAPGKIVVTNTLNATTVNSSGMFEVYPDAAVTIGTLNASEGSPLNVLIEGTANITTLNANGDNSVVVSDGGVLNANTITSTILSDNTTSLIIADGGQVKCTSDFVATIKKNITGYGSQRENNNGGYCLFATPLDGSANNIVVPRVGESYLFDEVDLYWFDGTAPDGMEWINAKAGESYIHGLVTLVPTQGYLYARAYDGEVSISANNMDKFSRTDQDIVVGNLNSSTTTPLGNINLIGNPYTCNAYLKQGDNYIPYYRMNASGDAIVGVAAGTPIKPCEGVFMCITDTSSPVTFTTTEPASPGQAQSGPAVLLPMHQLLVNQDASVVDQAIALVLSQGWNWWAPMVQTTAAQIRAVLGTNLQEFKTRTGDVATDAVLEPGQMYRIQINEAANGVTITGVPTTACISIGEGSNWIGFTSVATTGISATLDMYGIIPVEGDKVISQDQGFAIFNGTSWEGTLSTLESGKGYVYIRMVSGN